jgi:glycosyltransferase involved in cell wall biosynthesis
MISILIPTYNYNVYPLVEKIHNQATESKLDFEIRVYDDCSPNPVVENEAIQLLANGYYKKLEKNIGRSAIRNLLAEEAKYKTLLFLDADTMVFNNSFIHNYIEAIEVNTQIIYGGIVYQKEAPPAEEILRWKYGNSREALPVSERIKQPHLRFLTLNFLIKKEVFNVLKFNEEIPNLRHEDTLFALDAKKKNIRVQHIENPVTHLGLERSEVFLRKSNESVEALNLFVKEGLIKPSETALSQKADTLQKQKLAGPIKYFYTLFKSVMEKNLLSKNPSLFIFDVYRLGYYLQIASR